MEKLEIYDFRNFRSEIRPMMTSMIRVSLLTTLVIYKAYFKKVIKHGNKDLELIYFVRSYCVYAP